MIRIECLLQTQLQLLQRGRRTLHHLGILGCAAKQTDLPAGLSGDGFQLGQRLRTAIPALRPAPVQTPVTIQHRHARARVDGETP